MVGSTQGKVAEVNACWRAPAKKLLESGWEEGAVQGTTRSQTQKAPGDSDTRAQA